MFRNTNFKPNTMIYFRENSIDNFVLIVKLNLYFCDVMMSSSQTCTYIRYLNDALLQLVGYKRELNNVFITFLTFRNLRKSDIGQFIYDYYKVSNRILCIKSNI